MRSFSILQIVTIFCCLRHLESFITINSKKWKYSSIDSNRLDDTFECKAASSPWTTAIAITIAAVLLPQLVNIPNAEAAIPIFTTAAANKITITDTPNKEKLFNAESNIPQDVRKILRDKFTVLRSDVTAFLPQLVNIHSAQAAIPSFTSAAAIEITTLDTPITTVDTPKKIKRYNTDSNIPLDVTKILRDRFTVLRSDVTGEKIGTLRVGDSLVSRLRAVDLELNNIQEDIFKEPADWDVIAVYPKVLRAYSTLFTAYTDRAFPSNDPIDKALKYALRYEVGALYGGVQDLEKGIEKKSARQAQRAFAKISLAYDHYLKAGDLYLGYDKFDRENTEAAYGNQVYAELAKTKLSYVAPSLEAPGLQDDVVLLKGPDKGRTGKVLWISKGEKLQGASVVVKLEAKSVGKHREVNSYPYSLVAKTTPPAVQFIDALSAAYVASAISSGIMFPVDTYKTRIQSGSRGIPLAAEGGIFRLWSGVQFFILDANDAVYVAAYGLIKPAFLVPVDPTNAIAVFIALTLAGALGDAIGSVFRVPCEIVCKQVQTGRLTAAQGSVVLYETVRDSINGNSVKRGNNVGASVRRVVALSWIAVLCRDMPFAGLQIAFFDGYRSLFSFLDEAGWSTFSQRAVWGAFAGKHLFFKNIVCLHVLLSVCTCIHVFIRVSLYIVYVLSTSGVTKKI